MNTNSLSVSSARPNFSITGDIELEHGQSDASARSTTQEEGTRNGRTPPLVRIEGAYRKEERPLLFQEYERERSKDRAAIEVAQKKPPSFSTKSIWTLNTACLAC